MSEELLWQSDLGNGSYQNPILYADYSDPDVIRVEDTYYMTASSFNYTPGLPILISKDLVNWELKNYALPTINFDRYEKPAHGKGVWAPSIRYHNNLFWITYGMPDEGIFIINTNDPLGKWSDPVLLLEGKGFIDPCPFWDDDGKAYIVHGYARSRIGFKSILGLFEIAYDGSKALGDDTFIFDGTRTQVTIEGPKVMKRNGYYYILAPAGGVKTGWQTVLRGKQLLGPYEERIVMAQGSTGINGPHQGGLVDTPFGDEWFIHFQDKGCYGRIVHLQPVIWAEDWPVIGIKPNELGCGEPVMMHNKPKTATLCQPLYLQGSDDFKSGNLGLQWQWLGNQKPNFYDFCSEGLRLFALNTSQEERVTLWNSSNVLTQKFLCPSFDAEVIMNFSQLEYGEQSGIVVMGGQYYYLAIKKDSETRLILRESQGIGELRTEVTLWEKVLTQDIKAHTLETITFKVFIDGIEDKPIVQMGYHFGKSDFEMINHFFEPSEHTWVGAKVGIFAVALDDHMHKGFSQFQSFKLKRR